MKIEGIISITSKNVNRDLVKHDLRNVDEINPHQYE